jgi:N-acetylneuraminate synthase
MFKNFKSNQTYIIAEIGGNFTNFAEARHLIDLASEAGVDAIKLQTFKAETLTTKSALFDMENTGVTSQFDLFAKYQIDEVLHKQIFNHIDTKGLDWFSTPSHQTDVDLLEKLNVGAHKVGSDDAVNLPLLRYIAEKQKPILLSTGMCTLLEVRESVNAILASGNERILLLHAITSYPTHPQHVNLKAIQTLAREFPELIIGYSDHTIGITASLCAVAMGAQIIEKHFTHDKKAEGPDHQLSADFAEMKELVTKIREFEQMRGTGIKRPADSETTTRKYNRKSLVLLKDLKAGDALNSENLGVKRPGLGLPPSFYDQLLGKVVKRDLKKDHLVGWGDV